MRRRLRNLLAACVLMAAWSALPPPLPAGAEGPSATTQRAGSRVAAPRPATQPASRPADRGGSPPATQPASLESCEALYRKGDYAGAARGYEKLISQGDLRVSAGIGLAEALAVQGRYAEALAALDRVADVAAERADWYLAKSELLGTIGLYQEALEHAGAAHRFRGDWAPAILAMGRALETLGRKKDAVAVYETMDKALADQSYRRDGRSLVALGQILDRFAVLTGRRASEQAQNILHNYLQRAYQEADKTYWPAHVAAGMFLLSKHQTAGAQEEFALAARLNPRIPAVHVGRGALHLREWRFEQCLREAESALAINPQYADALILKAMCYMQWRKFDQVVPLLEQVLKTNPNHLEALSLLAARTARLEGAQAVRPFAERIAKVDPSCALLPLTIGQWLSAGRQFEQAEKYLRRAIDLAPELAEPVTELGLMYMQTGQEDEARQVLRKARQIDDYRKDVYLYLQVLQKLEAFRRKETEHFVILLDATEDVVLLDRIAEYMESIYPEVCKDFEHEPREKTIIEVFPAHADFSVRIAGRGWIGTVGASTGRVIVMVAPDRRRSEFGTYNWATVLRHEFAHTVTLSATGNRIPHWFTEACAVWQQPDRQNYEAVEALAAATRARQLVPVRELDWAFIRPRRRADRGLAYAQAQWMLEFVIETRSYETVVKMLRGFRDGLSQADVFRTVVGLPEAEFDKTFAAWARKQVAAWGYPVDPPPTVSRAAAAVKQRPKDAAAHAELAEAYLHAGRPGDAENSARQALRLDEKAVRALGVLARVLLVGRKYDEAYEVAGRLKDLDSQSLTAAEVLARCHLERQRWAEAISALEMLKLRKPFDPWSYEELARLYMQLGQPVRALPNLIELHRRTLTDPQYARQIAEIYRSHLDQAERAADYWRQVVQINPYEASAYKALTEIHLSLEQYVQAVSTAEDHTLLQGESADAWTYLAVARYYLGRTGGDAAMLRSAKVAAEKALELDGQASMARRILARIEAALGEIRRPE